MGRFGRFPSMYGYPVKYIHVAWVKMFCVFFVLSLVVSLEQVTIIST